MNQAKKIFQSLFTAFLSKETNEKSEQVIIFIAIVSFILHLGLIALTDLEWIVTADYSKLLSSPISAIYTPFSFILLYEVYLLVYYLPQSFTIYIGKQYEIISLILIRRIFKDLANLELTSDWFQVKNDLQFTYDILGVIVLFFLIFWFYRLNKQRAKKRSTIKEIPAKITRFIGMKKVIAAILVPTFLLMALYSFGNWMYDNLFSISQMLDSIRDVNKIFFDEFFTVLILTDVLLLLLSLFHTDKFSKIMRNSGFIISTILIRLSFGVDGLLNTVLIVVAVLFGVIILIIHNHYEKMELMEIEEAKV